MKNNRNVLFALTGLLVAVFCFGCGGQRLPADLPRLYPTVVTVIQDGNPLPGALVTMTNVDPSIQWSGIAVTNASGRATIMTNGMWAGAPAGTYRATVVKQERPEEGQDPFLASAPDPEVDMDAFQAWRMANEDRIAAAQRQPSPPPFDLVDPRFGNPSTSTLEVTIVSGGRNANQHTLDVGEAVRIPYAGPRR